MSASPLPEAFADLEPWAAGWAQPDEGTRQRKLIASDIGELRAFYDAMLPRLEAVITYLDTFALDAMPAEAKRLFDLAQTFVECAHPIELRWPRTEIDDPPINCRFEFVI